MVKKIKIKLNKNGKIPVKATRGSAGYDIFAAEEPNINDKFIEYKTGFFLDIPYGFYASIVPRSSISNYDLVMCNAPGTIDSDYRGEILVRFKLIDSRKDIYKKGDRIAQIIIHDCTYLDFLEVEELSNEGLTRTGGFGSTGK